MSRFTSTWVVVGLAVALGVVAWWVRRDDSAQAPAQEGIVQIDPSDVQRLVIERPGAEAIVVERGDAGWQVTAPLAWPADTGALFSLLDALRNLTPEARFDDPDALSAYGLDPPQFTFTVGTAEGDTRLLFGAETPVGYGRYVKLADGTAVFTLPGDVASRFDLDLTGVREKQLVGVRVEDIRQVRLQSMGGSAIVIARQDGDWRLVEPEGAADAAKVENLLWQLVSLQASEFVDDPESPEQYGLAAPALRAQITTGEGEQAATYTVMIGEVADEESWTGKAFYARRAGDPTVFRLSGDLTDLVSISVDDLKASS